MLLWFSVRGVWNRSLDSKVPGSAAHALSHRILTHPFSLAGVMSDT